MEGTKRPVKPGRPRLDLGKGLAEEVKRETVQIKAEN